MRFFILAMIILLIVLIPMLILVIWFTFEFDSYRPTGRSYGMASQNQVPQLEYPFPYSFSFPSGRWELELMDTESGRRIRKVFQGELILGRSVGENEPTGWLYISDARTVSRRQCRLSNTAMGLFVENLSDVNITRLNGMPVQSPKRILPGDYISFGGRQYWVTTLQRCS